MKQTRQPRFGSRLIVVHFFLLAFSGQILAGPAAQDSGWEKVAEHESITVYRREVPGSSLLAYRGEGIIPAPLDRVASVILDTSRHPEWASRVAEARTLREIAPGERIEYMRTDVPWPFKDRDFVYWAKLTVNRAEKSLRVELKSVSDPSLPPQDCCVRAQLHEGAFVLKPIEGGSKTWVQAEAHADPGGVIPKWIVNQVQKSFPKKSFQGLLKQVAKKDVVVNPALAEQLAR